MSVLYEWTIELTDRYGDVMESNFEDTLEEAKRRRDDLMPCRFGSTVRLALVRDEYNDNNGSLVDRSWAYLREDDDKFIGVYFTNSYGAETRHRIPKRFIEA